MVGIGLCTGSRRIGTLGVLDSLAGLEMRGWKGRSTGRRVDLKIYQMRERCGQMAELLGEIPCHMSTYWGKELKD